MQNISKPNFDIEEQEKTLFLLQISNSAFPTGTFNHSYGFETLFKNEIIHNGETFEKFCSDWLVYCLSRSEGIAVAKACEFAKIKDEESLIKLDDYVGALKLSKESRQASFMTGKALMDAFNNIFNKNGLNNFFIKIRDGKLEGHHSVVFGAICGLYRISILDTVLTFLHASVTSLANVACRLIPLGQTETQKIIKNSWSRIQEISKEIINADIEDMNTSTPIIDIASMNHENLKTRLCMS